MSRFVPNRSACQGRKTTRQHMIWLLGLLSGYDWRRNRSWRLRCSFFNLLHVGLQFWVHWRVVWLLLLGVSCATSTKTLRTRTSTSTSTSTTTPPPPSTSTIEQPCCASFLPRGKQRQHHLNDKSLCTSSSLSSSSCFYQRFIYIDTTYDKDTTGVCRRFSFHNRLGTAKTTRRTSRRTRHRSCRCCWMWIQMCSWIPGYDAIYHDW